MASRILLAVFFVFAGVMHFLKPRAYLAIMPPYIPEPLAMVYISGACEIMGGLAVLVPALRVWAGYGLVALLIAVFPANIHMALNNVQPKGWSLPAWVLWARLPLQGVLIWWVRVTCR
jgi:uncharacterized membrane protein